MSSNTYFELIYVIAQIPFFLRMYFQTKESLKEKRSINPEIFWLLSIIGSILVIVYGYLINSWAIWSMSLISIVYSFFHLKIEKERKR